MRYSRKRQGMTLVELLMGTALFGVVSLGAISLFTKQKKAERNADADIAAATLASNFFKQRRKIFQSASESENDNLDCRAFNNGDGVLGAEGSRVCRLEIPTVNLPEGEPIVPGPVNFDCISENCCGVDDDDPRRRFTFPGNTFRSISIDSSSCFGAVRETVSNACDDAAPMIQGLNFSALSDCERSLIQACAHPDCGAAPNLYHQMRVRITRITGDELEGLNPIRPGAGSVQNIPENSQGAVVGAALCMIPNGAVDPPGAFARSAVNPYTGINLRLLLITRNADNQVRLAITETSFTRPRLRISGSIIPGAIGCDKSQN